MAEAENRSRAVPGIFQPVGQADEFDWRVTQFDPPTRMAVASTAGLMSTSLTFDITAVGEGCDVSATIEAEPEGMMQLVEPLIAQGVRSTLAGGLARAKTLLEAAAAG